MKGFVGGYYTFCIWTMRLAYVNILWIAFSLLGLIGLGLMPATVAMFAVVRKWMRNEEDISIFKVFLNVYKKEFLKSNLVGYILFGIGYLLTLELHVLQAQTSHIYLIASFGIVALLFIYLIVLLYFFPIFVHFNLNTFHYIKWPFIIGVIHPILTLCMAGGVALFLYLAYITIPGILFFFGGSLTAYFLTWGASKTFPKYEQTRV